MGKCPHSCQHAILKASREIVKVVSLSDNVMPLMSKIVGLIFMRVGNMDVSVNFSEDQNVWISAVDLERAVHTGKPSNTSQLKLTDSREQNHRSEQHFTFCPMDRAREMLDV